METTTDLFNQLVASGHSADKAAKFVETVIQCAALSGTPTGEIIHTLQGVARTGVLRGDNLRYIMECLPALAQKIATGYGAAGVGELRRRTLLLPHVIDMVLKESK